VPPGEAAALAAPLSLTSGEMTWLEGRFGPFPFAAYGVLAVDAPIRFLNETQTLTVAPAGWLIHGVPRNPLWLITRYGLTHELTHQWFGDSVSPATWSDLWLNEGPATYFGFLYASAHGGTPFARDVRQWYAADKQQRPVDGPPAEPKNATFLFNGASVDYTGALVLAALQRKVGEQTFDRIMRAWVSRYRGGSATTADFIRNASQTSGRDLTGFLRAWLYGPVTPPLP
jgi:aminopeptidase N